MSRHLSRLPRLYALLALLRAIPGCGGRGGAPAGPTPDGPASPPSLAGAWQGTVTYRQALPAGHCFTEWLRVEGGAMGHAFQVVAEVQQDGTSLRGTLRGTQILTTCQFDGTVSPQGAVRWTQSACSEPCAPFAHPKLICPTLRVCARNHSFDGFASGTTLDGAHHVSWETFDAATGAPAGVVTIDGTLQVRR